MTSELPAGPELAPSNLTDDQGSFARTIGMTGLFAVLLGVLILILNAANAKLPVELGNNIGFAGIVVGLAMMFFHAARDSDELVRRLYGFVGGLGLPAAGAILSLLPLAISAAKAAPEGGGPRPLVSLFFPFGWACFLAGLFFLIPFCRLETDESQRRYGLMGLGGVGAVLALLGLAGGLFAPSFALTYGVVLALLGLGYLTALIGQLGGPDAEGYRPALLLGALGGLVFVGALGGSLFVRGYFVPTGLILMALGLLYAATALLLVSDWQLIVLTRRELAAYFYSPVAYLVLGMTTLIAWLAYVSFWGEVEGNPVVPEPVVARMLAGFWGIIPVLFIVPALTMRLLSEEKRTGTYEVLVCAPVSETPIVVSKVLAGLAMYLVTWTVWAGFLIAFRMENGKPYDYRPLLSFALAITVSGGAFVAMGVFFSALTRNQIIAAVLTFGGMLVLVFAYFASFLASPQWQPVWSKVTFLFLWWESLEGRLHLRDVIIQLSMAVFWAYLAVKVLEARRWS
ncbi:MAG TPA: ABC transporter permease [Gemmataceae bacterium]|jgi:ABC-2 type transport system permease protein|nr:ABC transporter permease [Gemmataceae bacterium]